MDRSSTSDEELKLQQQQSKQQRGGLKEFQASLYLKLQQPSEKHERFEARQTFTSKEKQTEDLDAVFEEVTKEILDLKSFAHSSLGLSLDQSDVKQIFEKADSIEAQKRQVLIKWKENEISATASKLHSIAIQYKNLGHWREPFDTVMDKFSDWTVFSEIASSLFGLYLPSAIDRVEVGNDSVEEWKKQILIEWMRNGGKQCEGTSEKQREQECSNSEQTSNSREKETEEFDDVFEEVLKEIPDWTAFEKMVRSKFILYNSWGLSKIDQIIEEHDSVEERKRQILLNWKKTEWNATASEFRSRVTRYKKLGHLEGFIREAATDNSFSWYESLFDFGSVDLLSNINYFARKNKQVLIKWIENRENVTASDVNFIVVLYTLGFYRYLEDIFEEVMNEFEDWTSFKMFACSSHGLDMSQYAIDDICRRNYSARERSRQIMLKYTISRHGLLNAHYVRKSVESYKQRHLELLTSGKDFLKNVREFKKFALSRDGLHLSESDIKDIFEDDESSEQKKIDQMKHIWESKKGEQQTDLTLDHCIMSYIEADSIVINFIEAIWIPNYREQYSHEETQPLYGIHFGHEECTPVAVWFIHKNVKDENQIQKLKNLRRHRNIVSFICDGSYREYKFIAMEHPRTETLTATSQTQFDENLPIRLCLQLLNGLLFLHENDITHCNLSPETILISNDKRNLKLTGYHQILKFSDALLYSNYHSPEYVRGKIVTPEMNIYTAGIILAQILPDGRHPFIGNLPDSEMGSERKNPNLACLVVSNKTFAELIVQMLNLDPESRPTALQVLRDFTFHAYKIRAETLKAKLSFDIRCRKIQKRNERDESGILTTPSTRNRTTKPTTVRAAICNRPVTDEDIITAARNTSSRLSYQRCIIEFCDCGIKKKHLQLFHDRLHGNSKIKKFTVSYTDNIKQLIETICFIVCKYSVSSLSLEYDNLDDDAVALLQQYLLGRVGYRPWMLWKVRELDISYNKGIGSAGYEIVGQIFPEFFIKTLKAVDCDISDEKLEMFVKNLKGCELKELNISCNTGMTLKGFEILAKLIADKRVTRLRMSGCCLTDEAIDVFHKHLPQENSEQLLEELDLSYNPEITLYSYLGSVILQCGIRKLNLAGCRLNDEHFMRESTNHHEMDTVCMRDNFTIGDRIMEFAEHVKQSKLKELDISNCSFSAYELKSFREKLEGAELQCLYLGDKDRECDLRYMEEVCNLLPNVANFLHLQFHKLSDASRHYLKKHLGECMVSIKLSDGSTEEWLMSKTNLLSSPDASANATFIVQCKKTTKNGEEVIKWVQDESGMLKQTDRSLSTESRSTQSSIELVSIGEKTVSDDDIIEMAKKIACSKECVAEFCNCKITEDHLRLFCENVSSESKISRLTVSYIDNIAELLEMVCSILCKCRILSLSFKYDDLDDDAVNLLLKYLRENKIDSLKELDISYNKAISSTGYEKVGEILKEFQVGSLKAVDCDITDEKLGIILKVDSKLNGLNINYNTNLTKRGFEILAKFFANKGAKILKLGGCQLTKEVIDEFHEHLLSEDSKQLLQELDVSYNPMITPDTSLASIIVKCGIKKLNLAGCKLNEDHFIHMRESSSQQYEMDTICMRDNFTIDNCGLIEIARLVKRHDLKELDIRDCMLSAPELKAFREELGGAKLQCLYLGDEARQPGADYIEEICKLFTNVENVMYLQFHKLSNACRRLLRDHLGNCTVLVKLSDGSEEEWTKHQAPKRTYTDIYSHA